MENVKRIDKLTLFEMIKYPDTYSGLAEGLIELPVYGKLKIGKKLFSIPDTREELSERICYGQRLYLAREEINDFGIIIRIIGGYFYHGFYSLNNNDQKLTGIIKIIVNCLAKDIYPVALHIIKLMSELIDNEQKMLYKAPSKIELAAGVERLNVYAELNVLDFLRDAMKCTVLEVLETPYNECLVRLMNAKEIMDYQEKYQKLQMEEVELKSKKR